MLLNDSLTSQKLFIDTSCGARLLIELLGLWGVLGGSELVVVEQFLRLTMVHSLFLQTIGHVAKRGLWNLGTGKNKPISAWVKPRVSLSKKLPLPLQSHWTNTMSETGTPKAIGFPLPPVPPSTLKGVTWLEAPLLRDLHGTPLEGPGPKMDVLLYYSAILPTLPGTNMEVEFTSCL